MDLDDIGRLNIEVLDDIVNGLRPCRNVLMEGLRRTSHLIKAVSVARAVGRCPFEARLIEVMGASDFMASASVFPGKGLSVHQVLAVAVPRLFNDFLKYLDFTGAYKSIDDYVKEAFDELVTSGVPPIAEEGGIRKNIILSSARLMAGKFIELMRDVHNRELIDLSKARVRSELQLYDYKLHIRGIADLVVENPESKRGVVIEWKTSRGAEGGATPSSDELAQAYIYAILIAHRLGYPDGTKAVLECNVFPVIIRDRGRINPYSVSHCYPTANRVFDEKNLLNQIKFAATHLILSILDLRKVDNSWDRDKERKICGVKEGDKVVVKYRRVPKILFEDKHYLLNPKENKDYPCKSCGLKDACEFYLFSGHGMEEVDKLAWRARYRVFGVRENALQPFYALAKEGYINSFIRLDGASRADYFESLEFDSDGLKVRLRRPIREEEENRGIPLTVREGKPAIIFLRDADEIIYSTNFTGNVDSVSVRGDEVNVVVSFEGKYTRLEYFLLKELVEREPNLKQGVVVIEGNVDLTHIELTSIDAFQRATKKAVKEWKAPENEAMRVAFQNGYRVKRQLYMLFGPVN
jgi:CRISPR/Cas system-associated exonuclease Cas4 (RecB family)